MFPDLLGSLPKVEDVAIRGLGDVIRLHWLWILLRVTICQNWAPVSSIVRSLQDSITLWQLSPVLYIVIWQNIRKLLSGHYG
jgi:hypothetical protein